MISSEFFDLLNSYWLYSDIDIRRVSMAEIRTISTHGPWRFTDLITAIAPAQLAKMSALSLLHATKVANHPTLVKKGRMGRGGVDCC